MDKVARIRNLTKIINGKKIVDNLNFEINKGEIVGFLGPNGAGKTTTMRMMVGLNSITHGDVVINGYSIIKEMEKALQKVGGIIENPEMYDFMTGYDNLLYFQRMHGRINKDKVNFIIKLVGLEQVIKEKVKTYSLGMKQRLGIAQALLHEPNLLILDEPTNGLDPSGIREIREYLRELAKKRGISIFISSHLLSEIELLCDRIIIIQNGVITDYEDMNNQNYNEIDVKISFKIEPTLKAREFMIEKGYKVEEKEGHIIIEIPFNRVPNINRELVKNDFSIYTVEMIKETIEERFFSKTLEEGDV